MKILRKISDLLDTICGAIIVIMIAALVIVVTMQIVWRTWFTSRPWTEEVTRYLLIWATYFGATCVYRHSGNISITVLQNLMPEKISKAMRILVHVLCLFVFVILAYYGIRYCGKLTKTATSIPFKMKEIYSCMPISMIIMAYHAFVMGLDEFLSKPSKEA